MHKKYLIILLLLLILTYNISVTLIFIKQYKLKYINHFNIYNGNNEGIILGFSISKNKNYNELFICSLCKVARNKTYLILFINYKNNLSQYNICSNRNIKLIKINNYYPYYPNEDQIYPINKEYLLLRIPNLSRSSHFWNIMRFYIIKVWLEKYGNFNTEYLLCDTRDIIFQCDPFQWDYKWISVYTNSSFLFNKRILNSGNIYGDYKSINTFLDELILFMSHNHPENVDQGAVIYIIYTYTKWKFPITIFTSGFGPFRSISRIIDKVKIINSTLYNEDYTIPCIVHQYDRGIKSNIYIKQMIKKLFTY